MKEEKIKITEIGNFCDKAGFVVIIKNFLMKYFINWKILIIIIVITFGIIIYLVYYYFADIEKK